MGFFRENRRATLSNITIKINNIELVTVSSRTVSRRLFESGYKHRTVTKKITIGPRNCEKRLHNYRTKLHWNVEENWSRVIFSDETKLWLYGNWQNCEMLCYVFRVYCVLRCQYLDSSWWKSEKYINTLD